MTPRAHKRTPPLNEILRILTNNALFNTWCHIQQVADEQKFVTWVEAFQGIGHGFSRKVVTPPLSQSQRREKLWDDEDKQVRIKDSINRHLSDTFDEQH